MANNKIFIALALALLALLLAGCTVQPTSPVPGPAEQQVGVSWLEQNWAATCLVLVLATIFFLAISYMVSEATNSRELKAWTITEFFQACMSALIIFMLVLLFASLSQLSSSITGTLTADPASAFHCTSAECHIDLAQAYLSTVRVNVAQPYAKHELFSAVNAIKESTFKVSLVAVDLIPLFFSGFSARPYAGKSIIADRHMLLFDYSSRLSASLYAQEKLLSALQKGIVPLLLIGGVLLRSVFFLRRAGGLMIAIAIGLFTVFPLMYMLAWYTQPINFTVQSTSLNGISPDPTLNPGEISDTYPVGTTALCKSACEASANPLAHSDCDSYCKSRWTDTTTGALDIKGYADCAVTRIDPAFLCDNFAECSASCSSLPSLADFAVCANTYMHTQHPELANCNYLMAAPPTDPYPLQCSFTDAGGTIYTCPSQYNNDCRITFRHYPDSDPNDGVPTGDPYSFDYMKTHGYPSSCLDPPGLAQACKNCFGDPVVSERLTLRVEPAAQSQFLPTQVGASQLGSPMYTNLLNFGKDVEGLGVLIMVGAILPMFNFVLTITFVKGLSPLLGGDVDIEGLMRLI